MHTAGGDQRFRVRTCFAVVDVVDAHAEDVDRKRRSNANGLLIMPAYNSPYARTTDLYG
jgi:hypothetical protein